MPESTEDQGASGFDFQRYLNIARRRHIHFLIPAFLGWLVVWGSSWFLEVRYKSGTLILVEQPTMPKNYVVPNVNDDLQERMQSIRQQVMSRTRLLSIIDKFHLYIGGRRHLSPDEKVARMIKDIDLELAQDTHGNDITAFRISFSAHDPHIAQLVASELTNLVITTNTSVVEEQSQSTTNFLKSQLELKRTQLLEQEQKVQSFEAAHQGTLPEQQASNLQILGGLHAQLQSAAGALATAKQQREFLQSQISEYRTMQGATRTVDGKPTGLAAIDQQLDQLNAKLADLKSKYTDQYPDVIAMKEQIATVTRSRAALVQELKNKAASSKADESPTDDPIANAPLLQLQAQFRANQLEIASRERDISDYNAKISQYEARVNAEPAVEQQLADLTRGYDQSKRDYDDLVKKESDSEQATNLTMMQQGERFTELDPAPLPSKPDFPNRLKFCGFGVAFGLFLGLAVVAFLEFLDDRLHSEAEIKALLPTTILTEIPEVFSEGDKRSMKARMIFGWALATAMAFVVLAGSAFSYLKS